VAATESVRCGTGPEEAALHLWLISPSRKQQVKAVTYSKANEWVVQQTVRESTIQQPAEELEVLCLGPCSTCSLLLVRIHLTREMPKWWATRWGFAGEAEPASGLRTAFPGTWGQCRAHAAESHSVCF